MNTNTVENFWLRVDKTNIEGCWPWLGSITRRGFGQFLILNKTWKSHRFSFFLEHPNFDESQELVHICSNKLCCNPSHLKVKQTRFTHICKSCTKPFVSKISRSKYCSKSCRSKDQHPVRKRQPTPPEKLFWGRVQKSTGDGCWSWVGSFDQDGYGVFKSGGKQSYRAHRFSYEYHIGTIQEGMAVCHKCDNRQCTNPDHLFLGTSIDNNRDRHRKGRTSRTSHLGWKHPKLTPEKVIRIRELYNSGMHKKDIANQFQVRWSTINSIIVGKTWKCV